MEKSSHWRIEFKLPKAFTPESPDEVHKEVSEEVERVERTPDAALEPEKFEAAQAETTQERVNRKVRELIASLELEGTALKAFNREYRAKMTATAWKVEKGEEPEVALTNCISLAYTNTIST